MLRHLREAHAAQDGAEPGGVALGLPVLRRSASACVGHTHSSPVTWEPCTILEAARARTPSGDWGAAGAEKNRP